MPKLEQEPRLVSPGADVIEWARRVTQAVNPLVDQAGSTAGGAAGQCYMQYQSPSALILWPYNGNKLFIAGQWYTIPNAGITLAPTGLTAGSSYNIYAYAVGAQIVLEASLLARSTDPVYGHQIKSGDASRTLVGKAYVQAGPLWDANNPLLTVSWFNRRRRSMTQNLSGSGLAFSLGTTPQSLGILGAGGNIYFLSWGEDAASMFGNMVANYGTGNVYIARASFFLSSGGGTPYASYSNVYTSQAAAGYWDGKYTMGQGTFPESLGSGIPGNGYWYANQEIWANVASSTITVYPGANTVEIMG